jgi:predicted Fe-S protein YdhL (DUF1289 family)
MIDSPCNKICTLNAENVCVGCGRSRDEIGGWTQFSVGEKRRVLERAKARLAALLTGAGGKEAQKK